jgi:hypothetical protein
VSFVRDDHAYTRGAGAIASMDAVSPARRRSMARAERALAVREALTVGAIETGQEAAFSRPPPKPPRPFPGGRRVPFRVKGLEAGFRPGTKFVKSPGSVIGPTKEPEPKATIEPKAISTALPTKGTTTIVGGGSGTSWTSGAKARSAAQIEMPPPEQLPEMPEEAPAAPIAAPTPKPKTSSNLLVYAAIGAAALWFLTRK